VANADYGGIDADAIDLGDTTETELGWLAQHPSSACDQGTFTLWKSAIVDLHLAAEDLISAAVANDNAAMRSAERSLKDARSALTLVDPAVAEMDTKCN
jgi:hypothetical protein